MQYKDYFIILEQMFLFVRKSSIFFYCSSDWLFDGFTMFEKYDTRNIRTRIYDKRNKQLCSFPLTFTRSLRLSLILNSGPRWTFRSERET